MRKVIVLISVELGLIFCAVVVGIMTSLLSLWVWATGTGIFLVVIPLGLYCRECLAWSQQAKSGVYSRVLRRLNLHPVSDYAASQLDNDFQRFRECLPDIQRCRKLIRPFAAPMGSVELGLQALLTGGDQLIELLSELGYLSQRLDALGIQYPSVAGSGSESDTALHVRLRCWNYWLIDLEVMINHDDLKKARRFPPVGAVKPPVVDKSDAQR